MSVTISHDEWRKALADAGIGGGVDDQSAMTVREWADIQKIPFNTARHQLDRLVLVGKAVRTYKMATNEYGRRQQCIAFRLVR